MTVFISGSRNVKILPKEVKLRINNIINKGLSILIGDCYGVDTLVQQYLYEVAYNKVTVYHINNEPRNNVGNFNTVKVRGNNQYLKDIVMTEHCDFGFVIIKDESIGSLNNIKRLNTFEKWSLVFDINKNNFYKSEEY